MSKRTFNTLFMLSSVDGKISTGKGDDRDTDKDYKKIEEIREGVKQYYTLEQKTDLHSLNSRKVMAKMGINSDNPVFNSDKENLVILDYSSKGEVDFEDIFIKLKQKYSVDRVTIQSGGILNAIFLRDGLIDRVSIVIPPVLIGGSETPSLVDGASLVSEDDLKYIKTMELLELNKLDKSFLHLVYSVNNK